MAQTCHTFYGFAGERRAAGFLDMRVTVFLQLVSNGCLPSPIRIADGVERWDLEALHDIVTGKAAIPQNEDVEA